MSIYNNFLYTVILLLFSFTVVFSSKKYKDIEPGFFKLIENPSFKNVFEFGKTNYQELAQFIQKNVTKEDEEELVCIQEDLVYTFNKQSKIIESLGCGYRIALYPNGVIKIF